MLKSGRDIYLGLFKYFYALKSSGLSLLLKKISFNRRRKNLKIIDTKSVTSLAEGLKTNIKLNHNEIKLNILNKEINFDYKEIKWNPNALTDNPGNQFINELNSFQWLKCSDNKLEAQTISYLILDWISQNKNENNITWEPYTTSLRIKNWVHWLRNTDIAPEISSIIKLSINQQLKRLYIDLEYHNPASHLLENLCGFISGCAYLIYSRQYFNNELEYQLEEIIEESIKQLNIQILADGSHFERSPMIHLRMIEAVKAIKENSDYLNQQTFLLPDILKKLKKLSKICEKKLSIMNDWLRKLTMPDGKISQFNDSEMLTSLCSAPDEQTELLDYSGYFIRHTKDISFIMSCKEASPSFQPEHSHCDILSYELSIKGIRAIIDTGTSTYDNETLRLLSRETEAHNLPMVQHQEQSEIWGQFYFGKKASIQKRCYNNENLTFETIIEDQYKQKISRAVIFKNNTISIEDNLLRRQMEGNFISLIHLAPNITIEATKTENNNTIKCYMTDKIIFSIITKANVRIDDYISFPEFGKAIGAKVLILSNKEAETLNYVIEW